MWFLGTAFPGRVMSRSVTISRHGMVVAGIVSDKTTTSTPSQRQSWKEIALHSHSRKRVPRDTDNYLLINVTTKSTKTGKDSAAGVKSASSLAKVARLTPQKIIMKRVVLSIMYISLQTNFIFDHQVRIINLSA
jgi:hypothetical protein